MAEVQRLRTVQAACHDLTVDVLRDLLARAEAGEIVGLVGSIETADHYEAVNTINGRAQAIGMLEMAKMSVVEGE